MRKLLFIAIIVVVIAGGFWFLLKRNVPFFSYQKALVGRGSFGNFLTSNYSFSTDTDLDGLSDAKEVIYGSDPLKADTDGDGFPDGKEVSAGFDPLVTGKGVGLLAERKNSSLTIQYFSWLQGQGDPDPNVSEDSVREFLQKKGLLSFSLPVILETDIKFTNDDPQKIADYLTLTNNLTLPEEGAPYLALAGRLAKNQSIADLERLLRTVGKQTSELTSAQTPPSLVELHRLYLGIWLELERIFEGLKETQTDPVLIYLNKKKGEWLIEKIGEAEKLRAELIAKIKLMPFQ